MSHPGRVQGGGWQPFCAVCVNGIRGVQAAWIKQFTTSLRLSERAGSGCLLARSLASGLPRGPTACTCLLLAGILLAAGTTDVQCALPDGALLPCFQRGPQACKVYLVSLCLLRGPWKNTRISFPRT